MNKAVKNTVLITGANRGIGLALAQHYSQKGYHIIALCRESSDALESLPEVTIIKNVDVSNPSQVANARQQLAGHTIDVLINNAGILSDEVLGHIDYESIQRQFEVNTLGPLRVTEAFKDHIKEGGKIGLITSRMGSIEDNTSGGRYGYRLSKAALNAVGKSLAHDLASRDIPVALLHPGYVRTDMVNHHGLIDPAEAASGLVKIMDNLSMNNTGQFWHSNGESLPW